MNKQELIEKLKTIDGGYGSRYYIAMGDVFELVEQLDEPQKVTVPQLVADYIKYAKESDWDLIDAMKGISYEDYDDLMKWFYKDNNQETFAQAWIFGYAVEKEKKYRVKVRGVAGNSRYLKCVGNAQNWIIGNNEEYVSIKSKHTRKELEDAGFGEVFNSPLFEVEEVE